MEKIIVARNIFKNHKDKQIIKGIDFEISPKTFVAIMGPSGAGKTTFMNILSGLEKASGKVVVMDKDIVAMKEPSLTKFRRKHMGYIFQEYNLVDFLSVKQNILAPLKFMRQKANKDFYEKILLATKLKEHENKTPDKLSGGQKQRVAIARCLMSEGEIIFADEPTGALDMHARDQIMKLLSEMVIQYGKTLILVTHDPHVASYADKIIFLVDGKIRHEVNKTSSFEIAKIIDELEHENV